MKKLYKIVFLAAASLYCVQAGAQASQPSALASFPSTNGKVNAVVWDSLNNRIYLGGSFTQVNGQARTKFAALDATSGSLLTWTLSVNNDINAMCLYKNMLYIGGAFTSVGGQTRGYAAKLNVSSMTLTSWNPGENGTVQAIAAQGSKIYMGGFFNSVLQRYDTSTAAIDTWTSGMGGNVNAIEIIGTNMYVGGNFSSVGGSARNNLAAFSLAGVTPTLDATWIPDADAPVNAIKYFNNLVYVGGAFSMAGGLGKIRAACLNPIGTAGGATSFGLNASSAGVVYAIAAKGNALYFGGSSFSTTTPARTNLLEYDLANNVITHWNPSASSGVYALATGINLVYAGGPFNYFAAYCARFTNPIDYDLGYLNLSQNSVCVGQPKPLSYTVDGGSGATTYTWSNTSTGISFVGASNLDTVKMNYSGVSAGTNTTSVYGTNGCINTNTLTATVNAYTFSLTINAGSSSLTCGDSLPVSESNNYSGGGALSYTWAPATGLNVTNANPVMCGTKATRMYTVTVASPEGCSAKDTVTIRVFPFGLTASSSFGTILCSTKDTLHALNQYTGPGAVTYTWSPSTNLSSPNAASPIAGPVLSTNYTLTASVSNGCVGNPQVVYVQVNPISLNASSSRGTIVCGESSQLGATPNYPGSGTLTYTWSPSNGLSNPNLVNPTASPTVNTTYTLTMHSPEGCSSTDQVTINVNSLQVNATNSYSVSCHQPVTLNTSANTPNPNLTYSWTPSTGLSSATSSSPTAVISSNTTYNVTMSLPGSGCANATNSISLTLLLPATPQICMVTVDSTSTRNIVYWDKSGMSAIDSFRIYREITTNNYQRVGAVHYNALSQFNDYGANPNVTTYRYKLTALDSCGNESAMSNYHNTIYIVSNNNGQYTWNPGYTIENSPNPVNNYLLMRDDNNTGAWHQVATTTGSQNTIVDPQYATYQSTANWQVVTAWNISCTPTARQSNGTLATIVKSKSNISNNRTTGIKNTEGGFVVYPNPTTGSLNINFQPGISGTVTVKILSVLGEEMYSETVSSASGKHPIDMSKFQNGVYLVQMSDINGTVIRRVVKN